ncbi:metal-dependent hydrolase [Halobacillus sp. A5]|uniref:metal-dependent hydrolase n=1 Tax=Halobacillus sp. A5 TaxID=2880263 RepID=UPI0020A6A317|nr:metal-dependent hydrolase [Halobacillus sp. A5]MCP3029280.1 metal-dependent hydrolase [Halobacillus sp. A5]
MLAPGHQALGLSSGLIVLTLLPRWGLVPDAPLEAVLFMLFVLFGSLLPDIDTPRSKLGYHFWRGLIFVLLIAFGCYLFAPDYLDQYRDELKVFVMLMAPLLVMVKSHRKMTHSLMFIGVLILYHAVITRFFEVPPYYFFGFITGVVSHLLGDYLTKRGIPVFYPIFKKHFRFIVTFKTGSSFEKGLVWSLSIWNIWFVVTQVF